MEKSLQDLQFFANLRCQGPCKAGVLLRAEKTADGGMRGIYVSFADGDFASVSRHARRSGTGNESQPHRRAACRRVRRRHGCRAAAMKAGTWNPIKINLWGDTVRAWPGIVGPLADQPTASYGADRPVRRRHE